MAAWAEISFSSIQLVESHIFYGKLPFTFYISLSQARLFVDINIFISTPLLHLNCAPTYLLHSCHSNRPQGQEARDRCRLVAGAEPNGADNPIFPPSPVWQPTKSQFCLISPGNFRLIRPMAYCLLMSSHTQQVQNQTPNFHPKSVPPACCFSHLSKWQLHPSRCSGQKPCHHPCFLPYLMLIPSANLAGSPFQYAQNPPHFLSLLPWATQLWYLVWRNAVHPSAHKYYLSCS